MDYVKLLFAAAIKNSAGLIRIERRKKALSDIYANFDKESRTRHLYEWDLAHPIAAFIPDALAELNAIAKLMPD